jgi:hypothetical protein
MSSYGTEPTSPGGMSSRRLTNRNTNRYSVTAIFSMAAEHDEEVEDDLARGSYLACKYTKGSAISQPFGLLQHKSDYES